MKIIHNILKVVISLSVFWTGMVLALPYPYTNSFESVEETSDWNLQGDWAISTADHTAWMADQGNSFLDNNPGEINQAIHDTGHEATLNGYVDIPATATQPTLSYRYKLGLVRYPDQMQVLIRTPGGSWQTLKRYTVQNNQSNYAKEELDLSAYKGQSVQLRFRQINGWRSGARLWTIDEFRIGDYQVNTFSYPYTNSFESVEETSDWNLQGDWAISTADHTAWMADQGNSFLDNNPGEINQAIHDTGHEATLNGYVDIPATATQPTLTFRQRLDYLQYPDQMQVQLRLSGGSWQTLKAFTSQNNQSNYVTEELDLSAYKGQSVQLRFRQINGWRSGARLWTIDEFCINDWGMSCIPRPVAEWRFDEPSWTGAVGEVIDSSGNGLHGVSKSGATTTPGKLCQAGRFNGSHYVQINNDSLLEVGKNNTDFSVSFWLKLEQGATGSYRNIMHKGGVWNERTFFLSMRPDNNRIHYRISTTHHWNEGGDSVNEIPLNTWTHIALIKQGNIYSLYLDGVLDSSVTLIGDSVSNTGDLYIGKKGFSSELGITGQIDEVQVFNRALNMSGLPIIMNQTRTCAVFGPDHFQISHDSNGIHCLGERIDVEVKDGSNQTFPGYTGTITLDTQTGTGNWLVTTGNGVLNDAIPNDGLATYTFDASDNGTVSFTLDYPSGPATFNIDVYEGSVRDDDTEGDITFAPSGFLLTASTVSNPPPVIINDRVTAQIAGNDFNVHVTAFGTTATHPECGVIESYDGAKSLDFLGSYIDPGTGTQSTLINNNAIAMAGSATSQTITFNRGQAALSVNYKDVGKIRFAVSDNNGSTTISGATNDFVVKPSGFRFASVKRTDGFSNPAAEDANGSMFVAAGDDFEIQVEAINSEGAITPNYGKETVPEGIGLNHTLIAPAGGNSGLLSGSLALQTGGLFRGLYNWDDVGIISLSASVADGDYLGAGNVTATSGNIGRFVPHHFIISNKLSGALEAMCPSGGFTYIGQPFGYASGNQPEFQIEAKNLTGSTTLNYSGNFAKLGISGVSILQMSQDSSNAMPVSHQQATASFSTVSNGVFKYTLGPDQFTYDRNNSPVGIFNSDIDLVIGSITDSDGVTDNFSATEILEPTAVNMRYGRLMIESAFGSELVDLVLLIKLQVYDSGTEDFISHSDDNCSSFSLLPLEMLDTLNPALLTKSLLPLIAGESTLTLSAPGAGNTGSLGVTLDAPTWLEFDWGRPVGEANRLEPKATASFGIYSGNDAFIYKREVR